MNTNNSDQISVPNIKLKNLLAVDFLLVSFLTTIFTDKSKLYWNALKLANTLIKENINYSLQIKDLKLKMSNLI